MPKLKLEELFDDIEPKEPAPKGAKATPTFKLGREVANVMPTITNVPYKIAIIGEAPGKDEEIEGIPFVGWSGKELDRHLSRFGIMRNACFVGNICQYRPPYNKIAYFDWDGPEIQNGLAVLKHDLTQFHPNIILLLGGSSFHAFKNPHVKPKKRKTKDGLQFVFPETIGDWRGSFFLSHASAPRPYCKCIGSYHPAAVLRNFEWTPYLLMDIKHCKLDAETPDLVLPQRDLRVDLTFEHIVSMLEDILLKQEPVGTDIEGYWNNWKCISFAPRRDFGFIVPWVDMAGKSLWTVEQEVVLLDLVTRIMVHPKITKIWQNGLYDRFVLQYGYRMPTCGPHHDIMLKHWELYCEMEKSLGVQASLYTREPYYKAEIESQDRETFWKYCIKDSAITKEIDEELDRYLKPESKQHYNFNLTLLNSLLYMELRGIKYDHKLAKERLKEVERHIYELQYDLDKLANKGLRTTDKTLLRALLRDKMCYKRDPSKVKADYVDIFDDCMRILLGEGELTKSQIGKLSIETDSSLNVKGQGLKDYLYKTLGLPEQIDPVTGSITCDYEALITLRKKSEHPSLPIIIAITELRTRMQMLHMETDPDGRIRSSYVEVGSETGRITSKTSPTGSGYNLQTVPDENELKPEGHPLHNGMRDLLMADDDCYLIKCDLKGSDGWTIGANLAALGDSTMLEDLQFGLKPAALLCYAIRNGVNSISGKSRLDLKVMLKEIKKDDFLYFACKQTCWGMCYLMGNRKAAQQVFNVSEGSVTISESEVELIRQILFRRYNIQLWHQATERRLFDQPYPPRLLSPSGHIRIFFGRRQEILGQALAHEPQSITTYATNLAVYKCWTDPENRFVENSKTKLKVEPLHQIHDEFLSQCRIKDIDWALKKVKTWFDNPIIIAGVKITIPFSGSYGTDWSMGKDAKKGEFE